MKTIHNPVYSYEVVIFAGTPYKTAITFAEKKYKQPVPDASDTRIACVLTHSQIFSHIMWFSEKKPRYSTIAHECVHSVFHMMRQLEATIDANNEELFAYLHGWTMENVIYKLGMKR
jgi:hypothetical protein